MTGLGAATLVLIALLPGALFVWSFERWAGRFGIGLQDRALRFVGVSAVLLSIAAWPLYWLYANYWDTFVNRQALPQWFGFVPILYTIVPLVVGSLMGFGWKRAWSWARFVIGRDRTPRGWDHLFRDRPAGGALPAEIGHMDRWSLRRGQRAATVRCGIPRAAGSLSGRDPEPRSSHWRDTHR